MNRSTGTGRAEPPPRSIDDLVQSVAFAVRTAPVMADLLNPDPAETECRTDRTSRRERPDLVPYWTIKEKT